MQTDDIAVRVKPPGRAWQRFDVDPETPELTANAYGPDQASFTLRRDQRIPWADLAAFAPIEIDIAGTTVWSGRLKDTPGRNYDGTLNAEGWQYALDDVPIRRLYVHNRLSDWKDWRTNLAADLTKYTAGWGVEAGTGGIVLTNSDVVGTFPKAGAYLDLGVPGAAKRVVITFNNNAWAGTAHAYFFASDTVTDLNAAAGASSIVNLTAATSSTAAFTTSARYLLILADTDTDQASDRYLKITAAQAFGSTAWESGGASVLTADEVIKDAVAAGAAGLAADVSLIAVETFVIPALAALDFQTPREIADGVNALNNDVLRVGVDRRITWKPRATAPAFHVGAWSDYEFEDASLNNGQEIYNQVAVTGTAPDGSQSVTELSQTVPLLDMSGTTRKKIVTVDSPVDTAVGTRIGQTFLNSHRTSSMNGTVTFAGANALRGTGGQDIHPSLLLLAAQERIRFDDRVDPDTGGVGRDGVISTVTYRHEDRSVSVEVDNSPRSWDALMARYNLLAGAATGA